MAKSTTTIELLDFSEARAELLRRGVRMAERTFKRKVANREIASVLIAGRVYIAPNDIEAFIERSRREAVIA